MILVTGGTGFIGRALVRQLKAAGYEVRILIRPSAQSPAIPIGEPVNVALSTLDDRRGLLTAMSGVDTVCHLASAEWQGSYANLERIDIQGTSRVAEAAAQAGVRRIVYVSHLGADRASAFPVLKAKGIAEEHIRNSGIPYTILRSGILFGPGDAFTTGLGWLLFASPLAFLLPNEGNALLQPLAVEDLATAIVWLLQSAPEDSRTYEIGGNEYISLRQAASIVMDALGRRRPFVNVPLPVLRGLTVFLESLFPHLPVSAYWLDYFSANRTCSLDTLPRQFQLLPQRFSPPGLTYLRNVRWGRFLWHTLGRRKGEIAERPKAR
ncbi:MAG: complex I NDUFA9 subunit family protein [Anaerolineales bacterium]